MFISRLSWSPPPLSLSLSKPSKVRGIDSFLGKRSMSFSGVEVCDQETHGEDDLSDDGSQIIMGEKKRRLNIEQVKTLEKNFELGNKLEPERKMQLARALGLQPRQIAIWFQYRRAIWRTKKLEKDYDVLKRQFDVIKAQNDALHSQNKTLEAEIMALKNGEPTESINLNKETEGSCSNNRSESSSDIKLDISIAQAIDSPLPTQNNTNRSLFPPSIRTVGVAQLFQTASRPEVQYSKMDQSVKEESLSNMFCGIDHDQTGFWPWME